MLRIFLAAIVALASFAGPAAAQDSTRAEQLVEVRRAKLEALASPSPPGRLERWVRRVEAWSERTEGAGEEDEPAPVAIEFISGGLRSGSSLSGGLRLDLANARPSTQLALEVRGSIERYAGLKLVAGHDAGRRVGYTFAQLRHMPEEDFFGVGMLGEAPRTVYRHDELGAGGLWGVRRGGLLVGANAAFLHHRIGARKGEYPPLPEHYSGVPGYVPELGHLIVGGFIEFEGRDVPARLGYQTRFALARRSLQGLSLHASSGTYAAAFVRRFVDPRGRFDFTQLQAEAEQYLPFRNGFHRLVLRQLAAASFAARDAVIPFFLLPTLGAKRTLRAVDEGRYRDRHALLLNAEYRYQVWIFLDLALFADAGQVAPAFGDFALERTSFSYGAGLRFKGEDRLLLRVDFAQNLDEGFAVEASLGKLF